MINTNEFEYKNSRLQDLYSFLKKEGFNVYTPSSHEGECLTPYIVVKNDGGIKEADLSTIGSLYTIMCYVPKNSYSKLEPFVEHVKESMKALKPLFKHNGLETSSYYDDTVKGHMISIQYINYKKM